MDEENSSPLLTGHQRVMYEALAEGHVVLGAFYLGALYVLSQSANPYRFALAAHGFRELMEKLPQYKNLPVQKKGLSLKERVRVMQQAWVRVSKKSSCYSKRVWEGEIDQALEDFLAKIESFFGSVEADRPTRKKQTEALIRGLDPMGRALPYTIEKLRIEEWDECHNYFEGVSHHTTKTDGKEFDGWLNVLEAFLLDRLRPRTFEDLNSIDKIIKEGEESG